MGFIEMIFGYDEEWERRCDDNRYAAEVNRGNGKYGSDCTAAILGVLFLLVCCGGGYYLVRLLWSFVRGLMADAS